SIPRSLCFLSTDPLASGEYAAVCTNPLTAPERVVNSPPLSVIKTVFARSISRESLQGTRTFSTSAGELPATSKQEYSSFFKFRIDRYFLSFQEKRSRA